MPNLFSLIETCFVLFIIVWNVLLERKPIFATVCLFTVLFVMLRCAFSLLYSSCHGVLFTVLFVMLRCAFHCPIRHATVCFSLFYLSWHGVLFTVLFVMLRCAFHCSICHATVCLFTVLFVMLRCAFHCSICHATVCFSLKPMIPWTRVHSTNTSLHSETLYQQSKFNIWKRKFVFVCSKQCEFAYEHLLLQHNHLAQSIMHFNWIINICSTMPSSYMIQFKSILFFKSNNK